MVEVTRGGKSWFFVKAKYFEILVEVVGQKLRVHMGERGFFLDKVW